MPGLKPRSTVAQYFESFTGSGRYKKDQLSITFCMKNGCFVHTHSEDGHFYILEVLIIAKAFRIKNQSGEIITRVSKYLNEEADRSHV